MPDVSGVGGIVEALAEGGLECRADKAYRGVGQAITLSYYAHFVPEAGSKGRGAVDGLLGERGRAACRSKLPGFSPASPTAILTRCTLMKMSVECKDEEMGGLGKCWKRS
ncbi:hypothetical protein [Streptomyces sp. bgisy082]|uniref:hypothetical protein n=1 Tax=Streptomyces sp. bgisy082 TaxID=3413776 RepID=UPI003D749205